MWQLLAATTTAAAASAAAAAASFRAHPLAGDLFFASCNLPECSTLSLDLFELSNQSITDLYDFPFDSFEDGFVADNALVGTELIMSLQYDGKPQQGYLLTVDLADKTVSPTGFNSTMCFNLWVAAADPDTVICLAVQPKCDGGSQCSEVHHISRSTRKDTRISSFLPDYAPYTVSTFDTKRNLIYSTFAPLNGGGDNVLLTLDASTGKVRNQTSFPYNLAFIELEYDPQTDLVYAVTEDGATGTTFFGTVDVETATATPLSSKAFFNTTYWNQFNTISTVAPEIGVFFSTAFHYEVPGPPPSEPVLHLVGNSLATGEVVYDEVVANPFCEIAWLPTPKRSNKGAASSQQAWRQQRLQQ
jgi:hypothetical protein